jgi:putative SOS response-associated peptidase YedK
MCGRFTLRTPLTVLVDQFHFDLGNATQLALRYNIAPTQEVAAVRLVDGKRKLALLRWGLIPIWAKDTKIASSTLNARADTVATILDPVDYDAWLNPESGDVNYLLAQFDADRMTAKAVSVYVNNGGAFTNTQ